MDLCFGNVTCQSLSELVDRDLLKGSIPEPDGAWCREFFAELTEQFRWSEGIFCEADWSIASCWPPAYAGELATVPCYTDFRDVHYTYTKNASASRLCFLNGTWSSYNNHSDCLLHQRETYDREAIGTEVAATLNQVCTFLYYFGYCLSLGSCFLAILMYARFRSLCRLRNIIHLNLITTYVLSAVSWVTMTLLFKSHSMQSLEEGNQQNLTNELRGLIVAFTYGQLTTFFWALCEGIYMTCILFRPHKLEQMTYWPFGFLGWILPGIITAIWTAVKFAFDAKGDWLRVISKYNFIFIAPVFTVLAVNLILLVVALHTILQKQTGASRTGSKVGRGVRSFLILLPLLGLTYVVVLVLPSEPGVTRAILTVAAAILVPIQGFFVSVMYCFCNRQVRGLLKFHCYRRLSGLRCFPATASPDDDTIDNGNPRDREVSTNRNFDLKNFRGNTNELQYMLNAKKTNQKLQRTPDTRAGSLRIPRMSLRSKLPVITV